MPVPKLRFAVLALAGLWIAGGFVGPVLAITPCCNVTAIDAKSGLVTARENGTKRTIQFQANAGLLKTIRVGQPISADFKTQKVAVDDGAPCCSITSVKP